MIPYPAYKPTGLPWLPQIPEHWKIVRNKNILIEKTDVVGENSSNYTLLSLTLSGVIPRDMENCKGKFPAEFDAYKIVQQGDIIFCLFDLDETPRTVGLSLNDGMITGAYDVFSIRGVNHKFIYYYYLNVDNKKALKPYYTGLRKVVNVSRFLELRFPVPPPDEQAQIVRYLDSMTAKINKLIRAKKKQIALLQEQKQAIINQAVTKGLNPNAEMKDSGNPDIGLIPTHWGLKNFSKISRIVRGASPRPAGDPRFFHGKDIPWITVAELTKDDNKYLFCTKDYLTFAGQQQSRTVGAGTLLLSNSGATLGVPKILKITGCINDGSVAFLSPQENIDYMYYSLKWQTERLRKLVAGYGQPNLNTTIVKNICIAIPPLHEQQEIVKYLDVQNKKINSMIASRIREISLQIEYKNSLTSSVITGQVDVRNIPVDDFDPADLVPETEDDPEEENSTEESVEQK